MTLSSQPFVSVIVPVFNGSDLLATCLQALEKQSYPIDRYEVIVVDNGSQEDIKAVTDRFKQVVLLYESRPGSYVARNRGLSQAKGQVIAFTDADCIPAVDWLEKGIAALFSVPNLGLAAGRIDLFVKDSSDPNPIELYETIAMNFRQNIVLEEHHFGATANLFTFKKVLDDVGFFDQNLKSGGDVEWGQRVFTKGYSQIYVDDARVDHPARDAWQDLHKRSIRVIGGRYDLLKRNSQSDWDTIVDLIVFLKPPFRSFFRIWANEDLPGFKQKLQFTGVMLAVRYVAIVERFRLQFGAGISDRG